MKYCPKCNVNVHHQLKNCPLCGQYLDEKNNNDKCAMYGNQDQIVKYPILKEPRAAIFQIALQCVATCRDGIFACY